jgi:surface protein
MSIRNVQQNSLNQRHMNAPRPIVRVPSTAGFQSGTGQWVRNPSWLALPSITDTDQKLVGLYAVFPSGGNFIALTASAAYTVDWGDGTAPVDVASGGQAEHEYDWADVDLDGTDAPVTFTASTDTVGRTAHGFIDGQIVSFASIATTTGITADTPYFVVNATADTFQLAATSGGSVIALTNDGTGTLLPYKQAIVTVTPQAGQNLTAINLNVRFSTLPARAYATGWLDLAISGPNFSASGLVVGGATVDHAYLKRAHLLNIGNCTSMNAMFSNCFSLQSVPLFNTAAVTNMASMFSSCLSLQSVPLFNTAAVTNMSQMFINCVSLQSVPLFNTAAVTSISAMFGSCFSLQSVPLFNTAAVTSMASMFQSCLSLQSVPLFNTAAVTNMAVMFNGCSSLQSVPLFNTAAVTNMSQMFLSCVSLQSVPLFNTAAGPSMSRMFNGCSSLQSVPLFNTAAVTIMDRVFEGCTSLQSVPSLNTSAVSSSANFSTMFLNCRSLSRIEAKEFNFTFSVTNCKLSVTALNEIFTNLPKVTTTQTITATGNYGATIVSKTSSGTTSGSTTVTIANTADLVTGMEISGVGISDAVAVTMQDSGDTVTRTAHGIPNDTPVSFATIVTTTGIDTYTTYYVVNATADTFQVADTISGSPRTLTTDGTGTLLYGTTITAITPNVDVTLSIPASATGSVTTVSGIAKRSIARLKNWAVTG